jgi:hypothetical protein
MRWKIRPDGPAIRGISASPTAKMTVDHRALNRHVVDVLRRELTPPSPVRVLEVGAGVGTMIARLVDWNVLCRADYRLLDIDRDSLAAASQWLSTWATSMGRNVRQLQDALQITGGSPAVDISIRSVCAEFREFLDRGPAGESVDLSDCERVSGYRRRPGDAAASLRTTGAEWALLVLDQLRRRDDLPPRRPLRRRTHRVVPPQHGRARSLGSACRDSRTGRHLFQHLLAAGATILGSGSSDWVMHAVDGKYPARESDLVEDILHTIDAELNCRADVDQASLRQWLATRREQLARGELVYIAHQLDFVGRRGPDVLVCIGLFPGGEWIRTFSSTRDGQRFRDFVRPVGAAYHPSNRRPRQTDKAVGAARGAATHGRTNAPTLSAPARRRGTERWNPFSSSGESAANSIFEISVLLMADTYTPPFCRSAPPNRWGERDLRDPTQAVRSPSIVLKLQDGYRWPESRRRPRHVVALL